MKIAYLINQYPKVSHTFIRREILALERQGLSVERFALRGWDEKVIDATDVAEQGKTRYVLQAGALGLVMAVLRMLVKNPLKLLNALKLTLQLGWRADRPLLIHAIYLAEACQLSLWLKETNTTHLHAHFGTNPAAIAQISSVLSGLPFSFTVHGPEEFDRPQFLKLGAKIAAAKFVVAISSFGKSQLQRWAHFADWSKIKVVHCGLEPGFYENINATQLRANAEVSRLVCVGRICEQKGQLLLIEALKLLNLKNIKPQLTLAGDGEMRTQVEALVAQYGLQSQVNITGWINSNQVKQALLAADAMILPSFAEGLPVVIMEAMALRKPVLTTYVAGIPELVQHEVNGWLFAAGSAQAIADAIESAMQTSAKTREQMGQAAFARATERHDIDTEAAKLAELFA